MDDPNITMEEYIRLDEEKAQKCGKVFNWETAKYAIAFNDGVSSETLSCEPTVSSLNNEIDFRISFDDSDYEDYTVFNFGGLPDLMADGLSARILMEHMDAQGVMIDLDTPGALQFQLGGARGRQSWRLCHRLITCSIAGRSQVHEKVTVTDLFYLRGMDVNSVNVPYLLARYLRLFAAGRKSGDLISRGKSMLTFFDIWAWVALGLERQPDATTGTLKAAKDAHIDDEGGQAILALV
ncbi:hypothetical protein Tco_1342272 [Tanacetum coccineum]